MKKNLEIKRALNDNNGVANAQFNIGNAYLQWGDYLNAMNNFKEAKVTYSDLENEPGVARSMNSIGIIYEEWKKSDEALANYTEALSIMEKYNDLVGVINNCANIGNVYSRNQEYNKALEYYKKALKKSEELGDQRLLANSLKNVGIVYSERSEYKTSEEYLEKALAISEKLDIAALSTDILHALGYNYTYQNQCETAIAYLTRSLELAKRIEYDQKIAQNYYYLSQAYMCADQGEKAKEYYRLNQSLLEESNKKLNDLRVQYETEKQEQEIEILNKQQELDQERLAVQDERMKNQLLIIIASMVGFSIVLVFSIVLLRMFRQKRKANILLAKQKEEIEEQRDKISKQRDTVEEQKEEIEDSIRYAKRIQSAVLIDEDDALMMLGKHFILFMPKDVVSGDFYWATKTDDWIVVTAADCTGHGVPGAFMSMLGVSFLNEIVRKKEVTNAAQVLDYLRCNIIEALKQTGEEGTQKDGMDMSLMAIHKDRKKALWAGANNPLWIIRKKALEERNEEIDNIDLIEEMLALSFVEVKADKMPVAIHVKMEGFTNHEIDLYEGDRIYLFTDGFQDQFGGPKGKKFKIKPAKRLLMESIDMDIKSQKIHLEKALLDWMSYTDTITNKPFEQVDDITIIGFEI